jgi:hypothetical protein
MQDLVASEQGFRFACWYGTCPFAGQLAVQTLAVFGSPYLFPRPDAALSNGNKPYMSVHYSGGKGRGENSHFNCTYLFLFCGGLLVAVNENCLWNSRIVCGLFSHRSHVMRSSLYLCLLVSKGPVDSIHPVLVASSWGDI